MAPRMWGLGSSDAFSRDPAASVAERRWLPILEPGFSDRGHCVGVCVEIQRFPSCGGSSPSLFAVDAVWRRRVWGKKPTPRQDPRRLLLPW